MGGLESGYTRSRTYRASDFCHDQVYGHAAIRELRSVTPSRPGGRPDVPMTERWADLGPLGAASWSP
jgi:hypothetical protein